MCATTASDLKYNKNPRPEVVIGSRANSPTAWGTGSPSTGSEGSPDLVTLYVRDNGIRSEIQQEPPARSRHRQSCQFANGMGNWLPLDRFGGIPGPGDAVCARQRHPI